MTKITTTAYGYALMWQCIICWRIRPETSGGVFDGATTRNPV